MKISKKMVGFFSALADETRLKILLGLTEGSKTVSGIHKSIGNDLTLSAVSHQLKSLENAGVVVYEKKGREKRFELSDEFCWCILRDAVEQFDKTKLKGGWKK